jgi:XTP/dITP diphosphohydrolase
MNVSYSLNFVTSNTNKLSALRKYLAPYHISITHRNFTLIEPQAQSIEEVAISKAMQAYHRVAAPVLVEDSGFCIDDLSGFPGPYTKYVIETIGISGLLRLSQQLPSRTCRFQSVLAYTEKEGQVNTFVDNNSWGVLAEEIDTTDCPAAWSDLWRIFVPSHSTKVLTAMSDEERNTVMLNWQANSVFTRFAQWFISRLDWKLDS